MGGETYLSILSTVSTILSALATLGMFIISRSQIKFIKETEKIKNTPYLYPVTHKFMKNKWIRFYENSNLDTPVVQKHYSELTNAEKEFCDFSKKFNMETYFYYLNGQLILVTKGDNTNKNSYIVEHNNIEIQLMNYGALITKIHINYIEQNFENGNSLYYKGGKDSYYTNAIMPNQAITIKLDEIKDENSIKSCQIAKKEYDTLKNYNMFEDIAPSKIVNYNEYIIGLSIWNQYNKKFSFKIKIYKKGERFYRDVIETK